MNPPLTKRTYPTWRSRTQKILIIEDDPFWQAIIGRLLKTLPIPTELRFVRNVHRAENLMYLMSFDLVVFDHVLEGNSLGHDFFLQARRKGVGTPMIMVSSIDHSELSYLSEHPMPVPFYCNKANGIALLGRLASLILTKPGNVL